jgi:hypothetical protein
MCIYTVALCAAANAEDTNPKVMKATKITDTAKVLFFIFFHSPLYFGDKTIDSGAI